MRTLNAKNRKGGRAGLPFFLTKTNQPSKLLWCMGILCVSALCAFPASGQAQPPIRRRPFLLQGLRQNRLALPPQAVQQDPAAVELLKLMASPKADYTGEQVTERISEQGSRVSRQQVKGDMRGRLRLDFLEPRELIGDVMLIAPNQFRYYHKRDNVLDIALWPTSMDADNREKKMLNALRQRRVSVQKVGEEVVVGRPAAIVQVIPAARGNRQFGAQAKFWIDIETGIKLKQEISGPRGLVSRSYFTAITPRADVSPKDFEPAFLQHAHPNPLFPTDAQQFSDVASAAPQLPFAPVIPTTLPPGFRLNGVWVFPSPNKRAVEHTAALLRYSDGVTNFNLYQRLANRNAAVTPPRQNAKRVIGRRGVQRWRVTGANGALLEIIYIGMLSPEQTQTVHDSLR